MNDMHHHASSMRISHKQITSFINRSSSFSRFRPMAGALFPGGPSVSGAAHLLVLGDAALTLRAATAVAPQQIMAIELVKMDQMRIKMT